MEELNHSPRWRIYFNGLHWPQWPGRSGGEIRDYHLIRHLTSIGEVWGSFLYREVSNNQSSLETLLREVHFADQITPKSSFLRLWSRTLRKAWVNGLPIPGKYPAEPTFYNVWIRATIAQAVVKDIQRINPHFVFTSPQINPLPLITKKGGKPKGSLWILASYDVETERLNRMQNAHKGISRLSRKLDALRAHKYEKELLNAVEGIITVSERDGDLLNAKYDVPKERILVVPNGVDVDYFYYLPPPPPQPPTVLFVGNLAYPPNQAAAWRLLRRIMPKVRQCLPEVHLWVVGRSPTKNLLRANSALDHIEGDVADLRPYYERAQAVAIPLESGSGTKLKVIEALSVGRTVIASPIAVEGLDNLRAGKDVLLAEDDKDFASHLCKVLRAPMALERMRRAARTKVEKLYSWNSVMAGINDWLTSLYSESGK